MTEWIIIAVVAVALVLVSRFGKQQGKTTRATRLMKQYKVMTREKLENAPAGELVDGAISRILAKAADDRRPDPLVVLANLPQPNTVVYTVWVVCKELAAGDYDSLMKTRAARSLADTAHTAFAAVGAAACAAAFEALHTAQERTPSLQQALRAAIQTECPLSLCEEYIRDHADDFLDA